MKRLWIALSVLVMVWGFSGVSLWHLTRAANQMEATLEQISGIVYRIQLLIGAAHINQSVPGQGHDGGPLIGHIIGQIGRAHV